MNRGTRGPEVAAYQAELVRLGYPLPKSTRADGTLDGIVGPEVLGATRLLEQDRRWPLSPRGSIAPETREAASHASEYLRGLDVSKHQGKIDWSAVAGAGYRWVYVKATEGRTYVDPLFEQHAHGAAEAGLSVGAYHFWWPERDPATQARHLAATIKGRSLLLYLPVCLDWEQEHGLSSRELGARLVALIEATRQEVGQTPLIYTSRRIVDRDLPGLDREAPVGAALASCPWWMVSWSRTQRPAQPWGARWSVWQTGPAQGVPGVEGPVDRNLLRLGTLLPIA